MDSLLSPVSLLLLFFFLGLLFFLRVAKERSVVGFKTCDPSPRLPPGPRGLPIVGSIHLLAAGLSHRTLAGLARRHGPLMLLRLGRVDLAVASSREAAEDVLRTHDLNFVSRPELAASELLDRGLGSPSHDAHWKHLRKVAAVEFFSARRVRSFAAIREEHVRDTIDRIGTAALSQTPVNVSEELLSATNSIASAAAVGGACRQQEKLLRLAREASKLAVGFAAADLFPWLGFVDVLAGMRSKLERMQRGLEEIAEEIIRDKEMRRGEGGDSKQYSKKEEEEEEEEDILDVLLRLKDDKTQEFPITLGTVKIVILEILVGGTETSAATVEWAMSELIRNPRVMEKAQREIREALKGKPNVEETDLGQLSYLKLVIKETLRLHPPAPLLLPRVAKETCQVIGYRVPAGTRMVVNVWALGRDPLNWTDAGRFEPERFEEDSTVDFKGTHFAYLPFGGGRRICPGMLFGLASVELALAQLLFHFDWSLPGKMKPEDLDMTETFGATVKKRSDLCLLATPHFPTN